MLGRFITADSIVSDIYDPQDLNRYAYARNNPMKYVDPDGHAYAETGGKYDLFSTYNVQTGNKVLDYTVISAYNTTRNLSAFAINALSNTLFISLEGWGHINDVKNSVIRKAGENPADVDAWLMMGAAGAFGRLGTLSRDAFRATSKGMETVAAKKIANEVPSTLARVIPGERAVTTLGRPGAQDVFVTAADDIAGLNASQLAKRLTIDPSDTFTVIKFPTPSNGLATPINRIDKGFIGGGRTAGGAREFVLPNQPIPSGAVMEVVR